MNRQKAFLVAALATEMVVSPVVGMLGGGWLDRHFSSAPRFFIGGLGLGTLAALRCGWRLVRLGKATMEDKSP